MPSIRLPRHFTSLTLAILVGGCTLGNTTFADQQPADNVATFSSPQSYRMYNILAAEMYLRQGDMGQAALHYVAAAQESSEPEVAQRAAELAVNIGDEALSARALKRWVELAPDSFEARQYQALANLRAGDYDAAVDDLVQIRDHIEEKEKRGFELMVFLLMEEPQTDKAFETFRRYVEREDASPRAQLALAALALNADRFEEALKAGEIALETGDQEQQEQAARLRSKALLEMERIPDAVSELEQVAKTSKNNELKLDYARMLILANRRSEATPIYKQLYASKPEDVDILYTLGLLYLEDKEYAFAEPLMKKLLDVPDKADDAHYFLGQIYEGQKRPEEAIASYKKATSSGFASDAMMQVAELLVETETLEAARQWLDEQRDASTSNGRKAMITALEAQLLHDQNMYQDAVGLFDRALELQPEDIEVLYARSLSQEQAGDFAAAEKDLRAILEKQPDNATVLNALGYMLTINTRRFEEAEKLIRKAIELRPDDPAIMDSMGWVLYRLGQVEEAESWLRKAYNELQEPEIASHLIEVLSEQGKTAEAKSILDEMLEAFPDDEMLNAVKSRLVNL